MTVVLPENTNGPNFGESCHCSLRDTNILRFLKITLQEGIGGPVTKDEIYCITVLLPRHNCEPRYEESLTKLLQTKA